MSKKKPVPKATKRTHPGRRAWEGSPEYRKTGTVNVGAGFTDDEIEFMKAVDQYKRDNHRPFPTWSEVLMILRALGYEKVKPPTPNPAVEQGASHHERG